MAQRNYPKAYYSRPRLVYPIGDYQVFDTVQHLENKSYLGKVHAFVGVLRGIETDPKWKDIKFSIEHVAIVNMDDTIAQPMANDVLTHIFRWDDKAKAERAVTPLAARWHPESDLVRGARLAESRSAGCGTSRSASARGSALRSRLSDQPALARPARRNRMGRTSSAGTNSPRQSEPPAARYVVPNEKEQPRRHREPLSPNTIPVPSLSRGWGGMTERSIKGLSQRPRPR